MTRHAGDGGRFRDKGDGCLVVLRAVLRRVAARLKCFISALGRVHPLRQLSLEACLSWRPMFSAYSSATKKPAVMYYELLAFSVDAAHKQSREPQHTDKSTTPTAAVKSTLLHCDIKNRPDKFNRNKRAWSTSPLIVVQNITTCVSGLLTPITEDDAGAGATATGAGATATGAGATATGASATETVSMSVSVST